MGGEYASTQGWVPGKAHHAVFLLRLEHSIATSAWPAAQTGASRKGDEEKRREEGRETSVYIPTYTPRQHMEEQSQTLQICRRGELPS